MFGASCLIVILSIVAWLQLAVRSHGHVLMDPFPSGGLQFSDCPYWLVKYAAFHSRTRATPEANYLLYIGTGTGLGDTLRGVKYVLKLAAATRRVLLIHDRKTSGVNRPGSLLVPSIINWAADWERLGIDSSAPDSAPYADITFTDRNNSEALELVGGATRVVRMSSAMMEEGPRMPFPGQGLYNGSSFQEEELSCAGCHYRLQQMLPASCSLRALFKASPPLQQEHSVVLQQLFNQSDPSYVAIHFRMGGFQSGMERGLVRAADNDQLRDEHVVMWVLRTLVCARRAARDHNITAPLLLLTDNARLWQLIWESRLGPDVVTTPFQAVHLQYDATQDEAVARTIYVDRMLLAGGRCILAPTQSGYNHQARLWAAKECFNPYDACRDLNQRQVLEMFYGFGWDSRKLRRLLRRLLRH